jgi:hypothetical protein
MDRTEVRSSLSELPTEPDLSKRPGRAEITEKTHPGEKHGKMSLVDLNHGG